MALISHHGFEKNQNTRTTLVLYGTQSESEYRKKTARMVLHESRQENIQEKQLREIVEGVSNKD